MLAKKISQVDYDQIKTWYEDRKQTPPNEEFLPPNGFIVDHIAAGFVFFTDSKSAIIDGYISNPYSKKSDRERALNLITNALIEIAKKQECKIIKCDTKLECVKIRATKHGFKSLGLYESFAMEIK